jgi:hypothetical protein
VLFYTQENVLKHYVSWPSFQEQKDISLRINNRTGFPKCIGFVDITLIVFENRPVLNREDFYYL